MITPALTSLLLAVALLTFPAVTARRRLFATHGAAVGPGREQPTSVMTERNMAVLVALAVGLLAAVAASGAARVPCALAGAGGSYWACRRFLRARGARSDPLALAAGWELLAVGMRAGLSLPVTVRAVAAEFTGPAADALREVADLLALGADPSSAWEPALREPTTADLARAARRTARTGSALAHVAADLALEARAGAGEHAEACAQRAAVWVCAPLGLCFLPAFLCLGVLPVAVGMASHLTVTW